MHGTLLVEDISRSRVTAVGRLPNPPRRERQDTLNTLESLVAMELLRTTPRFWSGAVLWIRFDPAAPGQYEAEVLCLDGFPAHASVSSPLWERIYRLTGLAQNISGAPAGHILLGVAWIAPRRWTWEARYYRRASVDSG